MPLQPRPSASPDDPRDTTTVAWTLVGFVLLWLVLDRTASYLGSFSGEAGILVCILVLIVAVGVEALLLGARASDALSRLGLRLPRNGVLGWTALLCAVLLCFYPLFSALTGYPLALREGWLLLMPGLFAQGGIAEEAVFRGFLFRRLRAGRSFWAGALRASPPFILVHLILFLTMDFAIAAAALLLSLAISFPLAWMFDMSGGSILPGAMLHFVVQGSIKLVDAGEHAVVLAVAWMVVSGVASWLIFLKRPPAVEAPS